MYAISSKFDILNSDVIVCGLEAAAGELKRSGRMRTLESKNVQHVFRISKGGHTWTNYRLYLYEFAPLLFNRKTSV